MRRTILPGAWALPAMVLLAALLVGAAAAAPAIDVKKEVSNDGGQTYVDANTAQDALTVTPSDALFFRLTVTNTGDVTLTDVTITDTQVTITGSVSLDPGAHVGLGYGGTWAEGLHENILTATDSGTGVTDSDSAWYDGVSHPALDLVKEVSADGGQTWHDANTAADALDVPEGTDPWFRFKVTNTGDVTLASITFQDSGVDITGSSFGDIPPGGGGTVFGFGTWSAGSHTNTATATGTPSIGSGTATDTDVAYWTGVPTPAPAIDLEKYVWDGTAWQDADSTSDAPGLLVGDDLRFRYVVTNSGNVDLTDVDVSDNVLGAIGTVASLAPSDFQEFTWTGTVPPVSGSGTAYKVNTGTATGTADSQSVTDSDQAYYGVLSPSVDLEKFVWDGSAWQDADTAPGPTLTSGTNPQFRFEIRNTGTVVLTTVTVTDDILGTIGSIGSVSPGLTYVLSKTGTWSAGQQTNVGTVSTTYAGREVTDTDSANYYGRGTPGLTVLKEVSVDATSGTDPDATWYDANAVPAPYVLVGGTVWYRTTVTNSGTVDLTAVSVADIDLLASPTDPVALAAGDSFTLYAHVTAAAGPHEDRATATDPGESVSAFDTAGYFGAAPSIDVEKEVSVDGGATWADADTLATAPIVPGGTSPWVQFTVSNLLGNVDLTGVTVTDSVYDLSAHPIGDLPVGHVETFFFSVPFVAGPNSDVATATGTPPGGLSDVTDTDAAYWSGGSPLSDGQYVTWSQGAYAGKGTAAKLLAKYWASAFPQGLEVGVVNGGNGYHWNPTATGLANLKKFLTAGGTSGMITKDAFDPTKPLYGGGALATQTAALGITLRLDSLGLLGTAGNFGNLVYSPTSSSDPWRGMTVSEIFAASNTALAGLQQGDPHFAALTDLVTKLNTAFDGGKVSGWARQNLQPS